MHMGKSLFKWAYSVLKTMNRVWEDPGSSLRLQFFYYDYEQVSKWLHLFPQLQTGYKKNYTLHYCLKSKSSNDTQVTYTEKKYPNTKLLFHHNFVVQALNSLLKL